MLLDYPEVQLMQRGQKARSFASSRAAADEAGNSILYGGIHYRDAIEQGLTQGRCVGQAVMNGLV